MSATDTLDGMARKKKNSGSGKKPNRTPSYALFARIELDLAEALREYLESSDVQPSLSAVTKTAIREFLAKRGHWPRKPKPPDGQPS